MDFGGHATKAYRTAPTPAVTGADLGPKRDDESAVDKPVREANGCLMWLMFT